MKNKLYIFSILLIFFGSLKASSKEALPVKSCDPLINSNKLIINNLDSMIFDLASATITTTYIDIPIYIKSDDVISGIDYRFKFNLAKMTFSSTQDYALVPPDPSVSTLSYFNTNDLFLRYTSTSTYSLGLPANGSPANGGQYLTKVRFMLTAPCVLLSTADFFTVTAWLNGTVCGFRFTNLDFSKYLPVANFTFGAAACVNSNIQILNTSTLSIGTITSTSWNFGNGAVSSVTNPVISYTTAGTYTTTLILSTTFGCKDTLITPLTINPLPVSVFSYSYDCIKDSVFFTNTSTIPSGTIGSSLWNFGDSSTPGNLANPAHHYNASGIYTVSLISTSGFSCTSTKTLQISILAKVSANFTTTNLSNCLGVVTTFTDLSVYSLGLSNWTWDFGDNSGGNSSQNPTHTYGTPGTYSITLIGSASDGCIGNITKTLTIFPKPSANFSVPNVTACAVVPLAFSNLSTSEAGSTYKWNFGDAGSSTTENPNHAYASAGIYTVKLLVTSPNGCIDSLSKPALLTIHDSPAATFSLSLACVKNNINFANNTTITTGSIISWNWDFGDNHKSNLQNPSNTYSVPGTYSVSLSGTSNRGCPGIFSQVVMVLDKAAAGFGNTNSVSCSGETINLTNLSTPETGSSYLWYFAAGATSTLQNPAYTYSVSGSYPIELLISNPGFCPDSVSKVFTVDLPAPAVANFSQSILSGAIVSFSNLSTGANSVAWDFGDAQISFENNPQHKFTESRNFNICLTAYNSASCATQFCKDFFVGVVVAIPSAFTPTQDNVNDVLKVRGGPFSEMYFQIFNEWGNLVFSSASQDLGWDGSFHGEPQPVGVYQYTFNGKTEDNKVINQIGVINLIR